MWNKLKSWFSVASVWDIAGVVATLLSFACVMSYFGGVTANWGIITFAIAGFWVWQKFSSKIKPITDMVGSVLWYVGTFAVALLTVYTFGASTLLGMYEDWATHQGSIWGFIRVFAPIITLVIGSIMIASVATKPRSFSKKLVIACSILTSFGLMLYGLVGPFDKWLAAKKLEQAQKFDLDRLKIDKSMGLVAEITGEYIKVYKKIKGDYFDYLSSVKVNNLPLADDLDKTLKDGPHKMIQVYLPDKNGEFTQYSSKAWVRHDEVDIKNKPLQFKGFTDQPLEDGKVHKITFASDDWVMVWENWPRGQKILISGFGKDIVYFRDGNREAGVPLSGVLTSNIDHPLEMKYKKGGILYITKK